jgi:hypothetical protein
MSDCYCDYDPPVFHSRAVRKARKNHKCYECRSPIFSGEQYEYVTGKWDGDIEVFKTCQHCVDLRIWVQNNVPCLCWGHGNMFDDLRDAIEDACDRAPSETVGLRFGFMRRIIIRDRINKEKRARIAA